MQLVNTHSLLSAGRVDAVLSAMMTCATAQVRAYMGQFIDVWHCALPQYALLHFLWCCLPSHRLSLRRCACTWSR